MVECGAVHVPVPLFLPLVQLSTAGESSARGTCREDYVDAQGATRLKITASSYYQRDFCD